MFNDLTYALRTLLKTPAFTISTLVALSLGIGANTAIFSVINATLLRPLPFPGADRLVRIYETFDKDGANTDKLNMSETTLRQWRDNGESIFESIGAATGASVTVGSNPGSRVQSFPAARIDSNFFNTVGLQ